MAALSTRLIVGLLPIKILKIYKSHRTGRDFYRYDVFAGFLFLFARKNVCGLDRSGILKHYSCLNLRGRDVSGVYEQKARVGVVYPEQTP